MCLVFVLDASDIDLWNIDANADLGLLDPDIPQ